MEVAIHRYETLRTDLSRVLRQGEAAKANGLFNEFVRDIDGLRDTITKNPALSSDDLRYLDISLLHLKDQAKYAVEGTNSDIVDYRNDVHCFGFDFAICVVAPHGWVIHDTAIHPSGEQMSLHPEDKPSGESNSVMTISTYSSSTIGTRIRKFLLAGSTDFSSHPMGITYRADSIKTKDGRTPIIRLIKTEPLEICAYIQVPSKVVEMKLRSKDKVSLQAAIPAFFELVGSFAYFDKGL